MKFFKKPVVAVLLCLIVVIAAPLLNTRIKLGRQCEKLNERFYSSGIADKLEALHVEADALAALAEANGLNADALRGASADLQDALSQRSSNAGQLHRYYDALRSQISATAAQLSEKKVAGADTVLLRIQNLQDDIASSSYNAEVRSFRTRYKSRFTHLMASLAGVHMPEEFA